MSTKFSLKSKFIAFFQFIKANWQHLPQAAGAIFRFKVDIIALSGQMVGGDENVVLLYVGRGRNLAHLKSKFLANTVAENSRKANLFTYRQGMKILEDSADVTFLDIGWPYHGFINRQGEYLEMPDWVSMWLPIGNDWDNIVKKFRSTTRKNDLRLIRRNQYRYEASHDPEVIKSFYDDFYLPFVNFRHAGDVILSSRKEVEKTATQGAVLQVIGDDGPVAAGVVYTDDNVLYFMWTGMQAAHVENPPEAAISALNYFCIRYAFDQSLEAVDFMGTRAFPDDGVYQFKRRWGASLDDSFSPNSILFKPASHNLKAVKFCEKFPFLARNKDNQLELVLCASGQAFGDAECKRLLSSFFCEGTQQVTVVHVPDKTGETSLSLSSEHSHVNVINSDLASFSQHYTRR